MSLAAKLLAGASEVTPVANCMVADIDEHSDDTSVFEDLPGGESRVAGGPSDRKHNGTKVEGHPDFQWDVNTEGVPPEAVKYCVDMLNRHRNAFAFNISELGRFKRLKFTIDIDEEAAKGKNLFRQQYRNKSVLENEIIEKQTAELARDGIVEPCKNQTRFASPITLPPKKDDKGNWTERRMCGDYRAINSVTKQDKYEMPTAESIFDSLRNKETGRISNVFSTLDLFKGYHQIEIDEESREKTAFWADRQLWQYVCMPFGLKNAGACFQRCMDYTLRHCERSGCYVDDVITHDAYDIPLLETALNDMGSDEAASGRTLAAWKQAVDDVEKALVAIEENNMRCHPVKSGFLYRKRKFLGYTVSENGVSPQQSKIRAIEAIPAPTNVSDVRSAMGLFNYYRRSVQGFSAIAYPINSLLKKDVVFKWGDEQQTAWEALKKLLTTAPHLVPPDYSRPFIVQTDWSNRGMGAVLAQLDSEGKERVIAYASRSCTPAEANYSSYKGELCAVVWAVKTWRRYLVGRELQIVTDHQPLHWLMTSKDLTGQHARWALQLQDYHFTITHRPGLQNPNADALSRSPDQTADAGDFDTGIEDVLPPLASPADRRGPLLSDEERIWAYGHQYRVVPEATTALSLGCNRDGVATDGERFDPLGLWQVAHTGAPAVYFELPDEVAAAAQMVLGLEVLNCLAALPEENVGDIWGDAHTLHFLKTGQHLPDVNAEARDRVTHRALRFQWANGKLYRIFGRDSTREVPPPAERETLAAKTHSQYGHLGVKRTVGLLTSGYWWRDMWKTVADVIKNCLSCDRNKAGFNIRPQHLNPLPIKGLGYRWHVDLFGELTPPSREGFRFVLVSVEAFSKWVELVPLRSKESLEVQSAFLTHVLARFGACAEVTSDQGLEFEGAFGEFLTSLGISHRPTSRNHAQANGQAERVVQTVKNCIRRTVDDHLERWPEALPWIAMGYRMSPQAALRYSPYYIMYGRTPVIPPAIMERMTEGLNLDDPDAAAKSIIERGILFQRIMPQALENLLISQHVNTLRYAETRSGGYKPSLRQFIVGEFVRLRDLSAGQNTLNMQATKSVLRIVEVRDSGVLVLQGRDGLTCREHVENCAPCRAIITDTTVDPTLAPFRDAGCPCERCNGVESDRPNKMLMCDHCNTGWHKNCLRLARIPDGDWFCPYCVSLGRTCRVVSGKNGDQSGVKSALVATGASTQLGFSPTRGLRYETSQEVYDALRLLMPGPWTRGHATYLFNSMPGGKYFLAHGNLHPERVPTLPEEYEPLFRYIDFTKTRSVLDPWCGNGSTRTQFKLLRLSAGISKGQLRIITSDIDPSVGAEHCGNALDPSFYCRLRNEREQIEVIVTSPWFRMLDLAIPIMLRFVKVALFVHVPGHYLHNMPEGRRLWFQKHARRILAIQGLPRGPMGRRCTWLCIFKSDRAQQSLLRLSSDDEVVRIVL